MVRIRLRRIGLKNQAVFRIMAAEKESPRNGRFLEVLGTYNPRTNPFTFEVKEDRIYYWLSNGAQPSESVEKLFKSVGLDERFARYKAGEDVEKLLAEAEEYYAKRVVDPRTSVVGAKRMSKRQAKKIADAKAASETASEEKAAE